MALSPDTLKALASLGAGVSVDARYYSPDTAKQVAAIVKTTGAQLIIENCGNYSPDTLKSIATLAGKQVLFVGASGG